MKLTDEQIAELAPEWATHYISCDLDKTILFEAVNKWQFLDLESGLWGNVRNAEVKITKGAKPIPRKPEPFDITQHEWSDEGVRLSKHNKEFIVLSTGRDLVLDKAVCLALAKHFGLTAEDLK